MRSVPFAMNSPTRSHYADNLQERHTDRPGLKQVLRVIWLRVHCTRNSCRRSARECGEKDNLSGGSLEIVEHATDDALTPQNSVLRLIATGRANKESRISSPPRKNR